MRKITAFIVIAALLVLSGCSSGKDWSDPESLASSALSSGAFNEQLTKVSDSAVGFSLYLLDSGNYTQGLFYISTGATAEEFAFIEASDDQSFQAAVDAASSRLEYQKTTFEGYAPNEVSKIENAKVLTDKTKRIVIYIVAADYTKLPESLR